jgi:hypothetical protein
MIPAGCDRLTRRPALSALAPVRPPSGLRFEFADDRHHRGFEGICQTVQDQERGVRFSPFHHADVVPGQMRSFPKFLLRQARGLASAANDPPERGREWIGHEDWLTKKFSQPVAFPPVYQVYLSFTAPGPDPTANRERPIGGFGDVDRSDCDLNGREEGWPCDPATATHHERVTPPGSPAQGGSGEKDHLCLGATKWGRSPVTSKQ